MSTTSRLALLVIAGTCLLLGRGCFPPEPLEEAPQASVSPTRPPLTDPGQCDPEPVSNPPRPRWSQQPNRVAPETTTGHDASSLGQYPVPEDNNPNPKGADLQNPSTNFHILQSLTMLASVGSRALGRLQGFQTDVNTPQVQGRCLCNAVSCIANNSTREACDTVCSASGCNGTLVWLPNDAFKSPTGAAKFAAKQLNLLDDLQDFTHSPVYQSINAALGSTVGGLENVNEITARMQCWVDLGMEGYHLGAYDKQRPDLHMCVGYYGHGAYAGLGESGKFQMGGRYSSHNLSASHRAQMRAGGWGITAFGKTLTLLPDVEFNIQLDGYHPFIHPNQNNPSSPYVWSRPNVQSDWEHQVASTVSAGINIDPHITPIEQVLGPYVLFPGGDLRPHPHAQGGHGVGSRGVQAALALPRRHQPEHRPDALLQPERVLKWGSQARRRSMRSIMPSRMNASEEDSCRS